MLKVGIIGLGGIARSHCDAIATLDDVEVVAVADLLEDKRNEYMQKYDVPRGYPSHAELLQDDEVEAVAVTLGHMLHHRLTIDSLNAGKHVLVEKPMAVSLQQCDEMIEVAAAKGLKLMVGLTQHFSGTALKAKEILDSGELGPLITAVSYMVKNWGYANRRPQYRSRFHGGGMWLTNGVHVVDRLNWVMGSQAMAVSASIGARAHYQAADDSSTAMIRYMNGLAGVAVAVGYADGGPCHDCHVIGANGSLRFATGGGKSSVQLGKGDQWQDVPFEPPPAGMTEEWRAFVQSIERNIEPPTPGEWGRHVMEILFAAEESAATGREVMLESGGRYRAQTSGTPVTMEHGWV